MKGFFALFPDISKHKPFKKVICDCSVLCSLVRTCPHSVVKAIKEKKKRQYFEFKWYHLKFMQRWVFWFGFSLGCFWVFFFFSFQTVASLKGAKNRRQLCCVSLPSSDLSLRTGLQQQRHRVSTVPIKLLISALKEP